MPVYLKQIGFSVFIIGILEGLAEATAGLSKSYFGKLSDINGRRLPFVRLGYLLSAVSKPMMGMLVYPIWIFFSRTTDRLGKGIRTGARDAMLSDEATPETKGRVFGLHRAMDTLGAVIGPSIALLYLYLNPGEYKSLFIIAFAPGLLSIGFTFLLHERATADKRIQFQSASLFSFIHYWKESPATYRKLLTGLLTFALINSSDVFLLLKIKETSVDDTSLIGVYIFYNLIYASAAYPLGRLSDKIGFKRTMLIGFCLFGIVYFGMGMTDSLVGFGVLFFVYGLYAAATESVAKAWISNITDKKDTATAIGTFTGFQSICTMIASGVAGWIWVRYGSTFMFSFSAAVAVLVIVYLMLIVPSDRNRNIV